MLTRLFGRIGRLVTERPVATVAAVAALAVIGLVLALGLQPSASTDTLVGRNSAAFKATDRFRKQFGDESVIVMVRGSLERTVLTSDLDRLIGLEGCLSGNVPPRALRELPPECSALARSKPAKVVYGPGTFINTAVGQIQKGFQAKQSDAAARGAAAAAAARAIAKQKGYPQAKQDALAKQAEQLAYSQFVRDSLQLALKYGLTSVPQVNNPQFVSQLVFDSSSGANVPKARFAYLFPSPNAALVQVRLRPNLTDAQRRDAIRLFRDAAAEPKFKMANGQRYIVTGIPWWSTLSRAASSTRSSSCSARPCWSWPPRSRSCSGRGCGCCRWRWRSPPRR